MDKKTPQSMFSRLGSPKFEHLKSLSTCSRIITCDQNSDLHQPRTFSKPFINFKIEVINNNMNKRKLDDSSPDEGYLTPSKKSFTTEDLTPDLRCFADSSSSLVRQESVYSIVRSNPALLNYTSVGSEVRETVSSQLLSEHPKLGSSTDPGGKNKTAARDLMCETVLSNPGPAFDYDVDDILCLNPNAAAGFLDDDENCMSPSCKIFPYGTVGCSEEVETGERAEVRKKIGHRVKDVKEDRGYFSLSYVNDQKGGGLVNSEHLMGNSEAHVKTDEGHCHPDRSSEPQCHEQIETSGRFSIVVDDLCPTVSGPLSEPINAHVECLVGDDVEEVWNIGPPIFESSICGSGSKSNSEQSSQVLKDVQDSVTEPVHSTLNREDTTVDTSYEATVLPPVQVKSEVVIPSYNPISHKPVYSPVPVPTTEATKTNANTHRPTQPAKCLSRRPVVFSSVMQWEEEKRLYVHSVVSHMYENPGAGHGAMSELLDLMSHVADQSAGMRGRAWRHPSDLTCRNYRRYFRNGAAEMTLYEWQAKNLLKHRRFDKVPKIFERSPCP